MHFSNWEFLPAAEDATFGILGSIMKLLDQPISLSDLKAIAKHSFGDLVKAVVDVRQGLIVIDASLHADEEAFLLEHGSDQADLWGINIYPDLPGEDMIEFDSMINLRPSYGNMSRSVDDEEIRRKIEAIVRTYVTS